MENIHNYDYEWRVWVCMHYCITDSGCMFAMPALWISCSLHSLPTPMGKGPWFLSTCRNVTRDSQVKTLLHSSMQDPHTRSGVAVFCVLCTQQTGKVHKLTSFQKRLTVTHHFLVIDLLVGFHGAPKHNVLFTKLLFQKLLPTKSTRNMDLGLFCLHNA